MKWLVTALLGSSLAVASLLVACQDGDPHLVATRELMAVLDLGRIMPGSIEAAMSAQASANPAMKPYEDVMVSWARKYIPWEAMEPQITEVYAQTFTTDELRDMITFYRTPTGRKTLEKMPELMQKGMEIGQALAMEHQEELQEMIKARREELEGK